MDINGWISNLTKNTASARMNFPEDATDEEVLDATRRALSAELRAVDRGDEDRPELWALKGDRIDRDYASAGKSSARIRLHRIR
ncbi:hypothetical protein SEA_PRAIRIE_77 [Arthrobacter phage Prairie]|uniref:Uncharacterized protein n=1 Tax=Arthrobacter phage Prairie TaxID=2816463 RepID=A0A8A5LUI0_9CAUD|nr:hypothetical protein SEA_PRAIRIE_77 [Arthrobacter phage Prairie]